MAKKTTTKKTTQKKTTKKGTLAVTNTTDLLGDGANPRKISDEAAEGLSNSLEKFGDLSGIVFNLRTNELVAGHQRMKQIEERWGEQEVVELDLDRGLGGIAVDEAHFFPVRLVDWSTAKQRMANAAANSQKISGKFTKELSSYLLEFAAEAGGEMPGVMDGCLLTELAAAGMDLSDATEDDGGDGEDASDGVEIEESFQVVVTCTDALDQEAVYSQMTEQGYDCRALTV